MNWKSPLNIPPGKAGDFEVSITEFPPMTTMDVINMRTAILSGCEPEQVTFHDSTTFHYLKHNGSTLMSDVPQEQYDMAKMALKCKGKVLVAGLGLGYIATLLAKRKSVTEVVVVELEAEIIDLVAKHIAHPKIKVKHANIWHYLESSDARFDYICLDTWSDTSEGEFYETVLPMRKKAYGLLNYPCRYPQKRILAWKEEVMRGQVKTGLITALQVPDLYNKLLDMPNAKFRKMCHDLRRYPIKPKFWGFLRAFKKISNASNKQTVDWAREWVNDWVDRIVDIDDESLPGIMARYSLP